MSHFYRRLGVLLPALTAVTLCLAATPGEAAARESNSLGVRAPHLATAQARIQDHKTSPANASETTTVRTGPAGVWTFGEQDRACYRGRRKLWQGSEGWVVKRVNLCP